MNTISKPLQHLIDEHGHQGWGDRVLLLATLSALAGNHRAAPSQFPDHPAAILVALAAHELVLMGDATTYGEAIAAVTR